MYKKQHSCSLLLLYFSTLLFNYCQSSLLDTINNITIAPTITTLHSINTSILDPIVKFEAYGNYIYRLSNNNKIHVWDMSDATFPNQKFVISPVNTIIDFAIQETTGFFSYLDNLGNVVIIKIFDGSIQTSFNVGFSSILSRIQMSWFSIFVTSPGNSSVCPKLYRFSRTNQTLLTIVNMDQLINDIRIAKCIKPITPVYQFIIGWDNTSFFQMYTFGDGWSNFYGYRNFIKNIPWAISDVEWSDWCQDYTATYQNLNQSTIYDGANGYIIKSYTFAQNIYSSNLFDPRKLILATFFHDNTAQLLDISQPGNSVFLTQTYSNLSYYNKFSQNSSTFFVATDKNILIYFMGCTNSYSLAIGICSQCNDNGVCYQAVNNASLNSSQNGNNNNTNSSNLTGFVNSSNISNSSYSSSNFSNTSNISSSNFSNTSNISSSNSSNPSNTSNTSNLTNSSNTSNLTNSSFNSNLTSNATLSQNQMNNNLIQKVSSMKDYLEKAMTIIGYAIMIMQCTPLVNYFLRFINFWSITSMYVLLNINLYPYFYQIMVQFYQISNISIFQILNFNVPWLQFGQNKVQGKYNEQFQLNTNFMDNLQQPFIMAFSCAISIYLYNKLVKVICSQNTFKKLRLDFYMGIQSSFVSQMNNFILPLSILFTTFNQNNFFEQLNLTIYTLFVLSCVMCPFAILLLNGQKVKKNAVIAPKSTHFLRPTNLKYKSIISHPYFDLFYVSLINIFIPGLIILEQPLWFIFIGGGLHLMRIWVDYLRKQFTINGILMSIEMLLFHISFSLFYFDFATEIIQFIILFTLGFLILGGLHQIFTVFFGVFYQIYRFFKSNKIETQQSSKQHQNNTPINEDNKKKFYAKKKCNKPKLKFATTSREIQTNPSSPIKFEIKKKKLTMQKNYYKLKKNTHFLNIQPSKKNQEENQSEIEKFDFQKRANTVIKFPKFSKKQSQ